MMGVWNWKPMLFSVVFLWSLESSTANGPPPNPGFFFIVNSPVLGRSDPYLHLYAMFAAPLDPDDTVEIEKEGGLVSKEVKTGTISEDKFTFGCYMITGLPNRYRGTRYGMYTAVLTSADGSSIVAPGFVRPPSTILDTRGLYTQTVWPVQSMSKELVPSPDTNIGVRWSPGCRRIQWSKGKKRNVNTGPRFELKTTDDAGIYTIRRGKRGSRGWFVQIHVIAASCERDEYLSGSTCVPRTDNPSCSNGGVPNDNKDTCACPPFFFGDGCQLEVKDFILAIYGTNIHCDHFNGGHPKCRGYLFCLGGLFGCKCSPGWYGNNCDQACPKGSWGVACSLSCPSTSPDCDRFFGPQENPK